MTTTHTQNRSWIAYAVVLPLVIVGLANGATDTAIGWVIPMTLGGGLTIGAVLLAIRSRQGHASFSPDSFERGGVDVLNISSVRVAGLGGLGLLVVAALVAFQYPLISAVMIAGAVGGVVAGTVMILIRRRHGTA